jgi:hypothetical protein
MTRPEHRPRAAAARRAAIVALTVALTAALLVDAPAAGADPGRPAATTTAPAASLGYFYQYKNATFANCLEYTICLYSEDSFLGTGFFFGGNYAPCEGWRFEGTKLSNHVWSIWNRASGPISVWSRYDDGTYRYVKLGLLPSGYSDASKFSYVMDAWVYDPNNSCTSLSLNIATD